LEKHRQEENKTATAISLETPSSGSPSQKRETLREKLKKAEENYKALEERYLRLAAEFDNFRKRWEKEKVQIIQRANGELIKSLLPVVDDLERALKASEGDGSEFREGIVLIYQKLMSIFKSQGLEVMETLGHPFDAQKHEAIFEMTKEGTSPGIVIEEYEKGYEWHGQVLRHAKVVVSK